MFLNDSINDETILILQFIKHNTIIMNLIMKSMKLSKSDLPLTLILNKSVHFYINMRYFNNNIKKFICIKLIIKIIKKMISFCNSIIQIK